MAAQQNLTPRTSWLTNLGSSGKKNWLSLLILALGILFPFIYALLSGQKATSGPASYWQGQLIAFFIMAVYAMSYDILIGYTGILSFGHAAFFGSGAYAMALFWKHVAPDFISKYNVTLPGGANITEISLLIVSILIVIVISILLGLLFSATSARVRGVYFAMITLAIADAIYLLSKATDFSKWTRADEGLHGFMIPAWLNPTSHRLQFYFLMLAFCVIVFLVLRRITESPTGRLFTALRENENRVSMIGYNPVTYRAISFMVSAVVAGLAGAMWSIWNNSATPSMTSALTTINALIMTIMGGLGTLIGPILGAGLMQIFGQFLSQWFGQRWPLVFGIIFIGLVMFLPYGIVGTFRMKKASWQQGWTRLVKLLRGK